MKRPAILITSLFFLGSFFLTPGLISLVQAAFFDVPSNHNYYDAVNYVESNGIVSGFPDGSFGPDELITRAAFTKIMAIAILGQEPVVPQTNCFPDVSPSDWFHPYVCWAAQNGIIDGYPDGTFTAWFNINFAEASKIMSNAFGLGDQSSLIPAAFAEEKPWFYSYVDHLGERHAIPLAVHSFTQFLSRGQMVEMIYRLKANITDKPSQTYASIESGNAASFTGEEEPIDEIPVTGGSMSLDQARDQLYTDLQLSAPSNADGIAITDLATELADKQVFPSSGDISSGLGDIGFNGGSSWVGTNACKSYDHAKEAVLAGGYFADMKINYDYIGLGVNKCSDDEFFLVVIGANK